MLATFTLATTRSLLGTWLGSAIGIVAADGDVTKSLDGRAVDQVPATTRT